MRRSTTFHLPPVYPITDRYISGKSTAEQVRLLISGGAKLIQVRDKEASSEELYAAVAECMQFTAPLSVKLIVNDRVDIALAAGADGVHLGQEDLDAEEARQLLGPSAIIGVSTHTLVQFEDAISRPIDYVALGPIFSTSSKPNHEKPVGLSGVKEARGKGPDIPLVAIGGITEQNAPDVLSSGADSIAVISAAVSGDITKRMKDLLNRAGEQHC